VESAADQIAQGCDKKGVGVKPSGGFEMHPEVFCHLSVLDIDFKQRLDMIGNKGQGHNQHILASLRRTFFNYLR
jgi:hypothetical protein